MAAVNASRRLPTLQAILFDFDGTLVDSECIHFQLWNKAVEPHGVVIDEPLYQKYLLGKVCTQNAEDIIRIFSLKVSPEKLALKKERLLAEYLKTQTLPLTHMAAEVITFCMSLNIKVALVTGSNRASVIPTLCTHNLQSSFDCIVTRDDVMHTKPAPESYLKALAQLQLPADQCVAVEDSANGIKSATGAGLKCFAVRNRFSDDGDFISADAVFNSLGDFKIQLFG